MVGSSVDGTEVTFVNGRYRLVQEDGHGAGAARLLGPLAEVFRARDLESGRDVALKRFLPHYGRDARFAVRFREQLKQLAPVKHPALVTIQDYGFDGECFFIVSEWVEGINLSTYLAEYGHRGGVAFSPEAAVYVARQVCAALTALHGAGLVHRGMKPENIFITSEGGNVKVADATLSQLASESGLSRTNVMMGSVAYMSPEQARGRPVGPQVDIYSLGVILFEMLTDELPFQSSDSWSLIRMHAQQAPPSPRDRNQAVSPELAAIVERALQKAPAERYATVEELDAALAPLPQGDELLWLVAPHAHLWSQVRGGVRRRLAVGKRLVTVWRRVQATVGEKMRPLAESGLLRLKEAVERRAAPLLERRQGFTFGQLLLLNFLLTFIVAFLLIYLLSGAVSDAQESSAAVSGGARSAEVRKALPAQAPTPTLAPTAAFAEQLPIVAATATEAATEPAPPIEAAQENGGGPGGGGNGPPPHAGPAGGPPGLSGDKPGRGRGGR